eukprot:Rhum_TRINITY_DN25584_c0_g1::Rhum_TRINITY_DN25584_c0_g1_i1::g.182421::m.182421/K19787/CARNMT1; carnosine N-methyltransferase
MSDSMTPAELEAEQQSYMRVTESMRRYYPTGVAGMANRKRHFMSLHPKYKQLFGGDERIEELFAEWGRCLEVNRQFLENIAQASEYLFECYWPDGAIKPLHETPTALDVDKVSSTLKQFVRDWGDEGLAERELCYKPLYEALEKNFPNRQERGSVKVLVPGSGLSRLAFEFSLRGFATQGNEFSHHMLIAGSFLLNHVSEPYCMTVHPYVDQSVNVLHREDQFRPCTIPDMCPRDALQDLEAQGLEQGDFAMVAGDFLEVYNQPDQIGQWGAVATCFFIDTAHNIFEYIETIHRILQPGGVWTNIGPLLYHFSDSDEPSVDLSYDEVREMMIRYGFTIDEERRVQSGYTTNARSMKWTVYNCIAFTARKTGEPQTPLGNQFAIQNPHMLKAKGAKPPQDPRHRDPTTGPAEAAPTHSHGGSPCDGHAHSHSHSHAHSHSHGSQGPR